MKKLLVLVVVAVLALNVTAQNRQIKFSHKKFSKLEKLARKKDKLIFVDCYTTWCGPCKMMLKDVFTIDRVADFFNKNFICTKVNMQGNKQGEKLKNRFEVKAFPTFLLVNGKGEVVHRVVGAYKADEFIQFFKEGLSKDLNTLALQKKYESGARDPKFMYYYLRSIRLDYADAKEKKVANDYFKNVNKADLLKKESWDLVQNFLNDPKTAEFLYVAQNRNELAKVVGEKAIDAKLFKAYDKQLTSYKFFYPAKGRTFDVEGEAKIIKNLQSLNFPRAKELLAKYVLNKYKRQNNWDKYAAIAQSVIDFDLFKLNANKCNEIGDFARNLSSQDSKYFLKRALEFATYASENETRVEHKTGLLNKKAEILSKLGKAKEAAKAKKESAAADKEAERTGKKIHSVPMMKMNVKK